MLTAVVSALVSPYVLAGIPIVGVIAQIVTAARAGSDGVWRAWRLTLCAVVAFCILIVAAIDLQMLGGADLAHQDDAAGRSHLFAWSMINWAGVSLVLLTITALIIAGVARVAVKRVGPRQMPSTAQAAVPDQSRRE